MIDPALLQLLRRENPWLDNPKAGQVELAARVPKDFLPRLQPDVAALDREGFPSDKATLVIGPRQAGKSTWVWHGLRDHMPRVLYLDCDLHRVREWCRDPSGFIADLRQIMPDVSAVFLDEAQHLDEAGLFLKGLIDRRIGCPVVVTGSSSYHLASRTRESLAGRARRARLFTLSLAEVSADAQALGAAIRQMRIREHFERHIVAGGYPAAWRSADPEPELASLVEAFVLRDASDLYRIERPDAFRSLLRLAARQTGSVVNLSEWASLLGISVPTVSSYLGLMEESHLLVRLPPFEGGKRAELTRSPKIYFLDCGLRNHLVGDLSPFGSRADRGPLLECWLLGELVRGLPHATSVAWWRTRSGAEVDFVLSDGAHRVGVEVKASALARPELTRSAHSFLEAYKPDLFLVANLGLATEAEVDGCPVEWLHVTSVVERLRTLLR